jgi:glutamate-1-semialdehyde 2,1-aminomutase
MQDPTNRYSASASYHEHAATRIAGAVNSNVRLLGTPLCFSEGQGAFLIDVDGNAYVDYALGMGPTILGHAAKPVMDAVERSLARGQIFAGQSRLESELAERMCHYIPGAELVRFGLTGSEMVQTGLRVARAATGRSKFVKFSGHYHGWLDNVLTNEVTFKSDRKASLTPAVPQTQGQSLGSLGDTVVLTWNDLSLLDAYTTAYGSMTAAIIMEPVMCNTGVIPPSQGFLEGARRLCDRYGIVLIVDEVITGFRLGLSGAQGQFGFVGDLAVFAKALGAGVPIAALTGRSTLMSLIASGSVNHSGTFNANVISMAAAIATLDALAGDDAAAFRRIHVHGQSLIEGIKAIAREANEPLIVQGYPSVFNTAFGAGKSIDSAEEYHRCDASRQRRFLNALLDRGVRPTSRGTWFVSASHNETHVDKTLSAVRESLAVSKQG